MKNKSPLISVIMPAYNVEAYIDQAISSILNQTHKNLELIVIDDCSTDRTGAVAESYVKKDSRVRVFYNEKNSKEWFCRNLGIEKAKGDYIAWMDSDDVAARTRLAKQLQFLNKRRDVDIVGTYFQLIDETGEPIKNHVNHNFFRGMLTKPYTNDHGLYLATIPASYLFRRAILSQFKKPYHRPVVVGTDTDFVFRVMEKNILIYNLPEQLYYYRLHDGQSTNQRNLTFMIISLVRYAVDCRRRFGFDPLDDIFKKYESIDKKTIIPALATIFKIKKLSNHAHFFSDWMQHGITCNAAHLRLLLSFIWHHPAIFITQAILLPAKMSYGKMRFLHKPWNMLKQKLAPARLYPIMVKLYLKLPFLHTPWRAIKKIGQHNANGKKTALKFVNTQTSQKKVAWAKRTEQVWFKPPSLPNLARSSKKNYHRQKNTNGF